MDFIGASEKRAFGGSGLDDLGRFEVIFPPWVFLATFCCGASRHLRFAGGSSSGNECFFWREYVRRGFLRTC